MQEHLVVTLDGTDYLVEPGTNLLEFIRSRDTFVPAICYNESMGPIQTCDTCMVEIDGEIARACGTTIDRPMNVKQITTMLNQVKRSIRSYLENICFIVRYVTIIMETVKSIILWMSGASSIKHMNIKKTL